MSTDGPRISVIVPVHNGSRVLARALEAIATSDLARDGWELIVVDDASTDDSAIVAGRFADTVVKLSGRARGPAYARNRGLELARGQIIVTVDADVCIHSDALRLLAACLTEDPAVGAVNGTYDVGDRQLGLVSSFRNLRRCYLQRKAVGDVDHYWPPCGAVRRSVLDQVGPFDEWHYWRPQAEGAELGQRIRAASYRIVLDRRIEGRHCKQWTLASSIASDLLNHGVPWMRLMIQGGNVGRIRAPSLSLREKATTALGCASLFAMALNVILPFDILRWIALACAFAVFVGAAPLFQFLASERDPLFAIRCIPLQLLHYVTTGISVVLAWSLHQTVGEPTRDVTDDAFAEIGLQTWPPIPRRLRSDVWKSTVEKTQS